MYKNQRLKKFNFGGGDYLQLLTQFGIPIFETVQEPLAQAVSKGLYGKDNYENIKQFDAQNQSLDNQVRNFTDPVITSVLSMKNPLYGIAYSTLSNLGNATREVKALEDPYGKKTYIETKERLFDVNPIASGIDAYSDVIDILKTHGLKAFKNKDVAKDLFLEYLDVLNPFFNTSRILGKNNYKKYNQEQEKINEMFTRKAAIEDAERSGLANVSAAQNRNLYYMNSTPFTRFKEGGWIGKAVNKMEKKGTKGDFRSYCQRKGYSKVTNECINKALNSKNERLRKMAQFAKNVKK